MVQSILAMAALAIITVALIGQAMEMRKIRIRTYGEGEVGHPNIFLDKKKCKMVYSHWYRNGFSLYCTICLIRSYF